ncbi:His-Xaa-Ser repeat protein HxsA2 [Pseudomonas sp. LA21]|uniref:His-Xaa-Ser repeat protein HxsA2 n=1 Tax=Pseudomonas sp. LA21 TaxID=2893373 RepID=UPI001FB7DBB2|nr:His-Xaa-Ser repeat protein HxsA2 [Pseudomonas sp. LA21]MCJ1887457.1 His-Xaa-Ser repeat protein HxsA2 [Pseudomonas sp. LA21]
MKKREFLLPLATLTAAITANQALASVAMPDTEKAGEGTAIENQGAALPIVNVGEQMVTGRQGDNLFSFILKRSEGGQLVASHYSHSSHASHSSHSSHYSSR